MIRVLVAEDMRILRDTLVSVLNLEDDIDVVAAVATGAAIVPAALEHRPDPAMLDIDMPGVDGLTAAAELHERRPGCRVVILTVLGRPGPCARRSPRSASGWTARRASRDSPYTVRPSTAVRAVRKTAPPTCSSTPRPGYGSTSHRTGTLMTTAANPATARRPGASSSADPARPRPLPPRARGPAPGCVLNEHRRLP
jgi:DNA-binding NarL/FixJ family response regulator